MQLTVHGVHVDIGSAYQTRVEEALKGLADKYKIEIISANAQLLKHNLGFTTEISAHIGRGVYMRGSDIADGAFTSVDAAVNKLDIKLRKYKKRLADHHRKRDIHFETAFAPYYVIRNEETEIETEENAKEKAKEEEGLAPPIIAETEESVPVLSVSDAVFYFDLSDKEAMLFKNAGTGAINMIYRRKDGNLGWVETK